MDVLTAIKIRRSIRKYEPRPIPPGDMETLIESARVAPSGKNLQPWELIVITDSETKQSLVPVCCNQRFVGECSVVIAGVDDPNAKWQRVDLAIAMEHIVLAAVELGLGTCWIGDFEPGPLKEMLGIPDERGVPICMTLGYPAHSPSARDRKALPDLFRSDDWRAPWP